MIGALLKRWREHRLPPPGTLTHDGWWEWHRGPESTEVIDTWVRGFSAGETSAMGGDTVRVFRRLTPPEEAYTSFTIYVSTVTESGEPDEEPLMATNERGSSYDVQPPDWLQTRIVAALPEWQGEESLVG